MGQDAFLIWAATVASAMALDFALPERTGLLLGAVAVCTVLLAYARRSREAESGPALLFALTLFLFVWGRPLLGLAFPDFDTDDVEVLGGVSVSAAGQKAYLHAVLYSMIGFGTALLASPRLRGLTPATGLNPPQPKLEAASPRHLAFWLGCFYLGAAASVLQSALYLRYFLEGGSYFELYLIGRNEATLPGLSLLASLLFLGYVGLVTYAPPADRRRGMWAALFVVLILAGLTRGSRGELFAQLLVGLWLHFFSRRRSPSMAFGLLLFPVLAMLAEGISLLRSGEVELGNELLVGQRLGWFLHIQGVSGELIPLAADRFGVSLSNVRFVLAPLLSPVRLLFDPEYGTQTEQYGSSSGLLAHELSYDMDPYLYLTGHGVGSSYLAEIYIVLGQAGVLLTTAGFVWLLQAYPRWARKSPKKQFILAASLPYILLAPRESLLLFVVPALKAFVIFSLFVWYARHVTSDYGGDTDIQSGPSAERDDPNVPAG
jgi:hypothetical protein